MAEYPEDEGYIVHLVDREEGDDFAFEFRNVEFLDSGWIKCVDPPSGDKSDGGGVSVTFYPPQQVSSVETYESR